MLHVRFDPWPKHSERRMATQRKHIVARWVLGLAAVALLLQLVRRTIEDWGTPESQRGLYLLLIALVAIAFAVGKRLIGRGK